MTPETRSIGRLKSERGAVFVQVGLAVLVLMAFNVFVIDYGIMWVGRHQAQNAADAGALAGAIVAVELYKLAREIPEETPATAVKPRRWWKET